MRGVRGFDGRDGGRSGGPLSWSVGWSSVWGLGVVCGLAGGVAGQIAEPAVGLVVGPAVGGAGEHWPVRWEVGEQVAVEWAFGSIEETARAEDGDAQTTRSMEGVALFRGVVERGEGEGVALRLACARLRLVVDTPYGEMVYDSEAEGEPEGLSAGLLPIAAGLMGRTVVFRLDASGRLVELSGNEDFDRPRTGAAKAGAVLGSDVMLVPAFFPMYGVGEPAGDSAEGGRCRSMPMLSVPPIDVAADVCVAESTAGPAEGEGGRTFVISSSGEPRLELAPGAPGSLREDSEVGRCSMTGEVATDSGGRLVSAETERRVSFGVDVSAVVGEEGAKVWRRYVWTGRLTREE